MVDRDQYINEFRGAVIGSITESTTSDEGFQNRTLRPILKMQNDLFVEVFKNYISKHKSDFQSYSTDKKLQFIENAIQKDIKFRNSLKGIIIGWFTVAEYNQYIANSSDLNKRMMNMVIERLGSQLILFDVAALNAE